MKDTEKKKLWTHHVGAGGWRGRVVAVDEVARPDDAHGQEELLRGARDIRAGENDFGEDRTEQRLGKVIGKRATVRPVYAGCVARPPAMSDA